MQNSFPIATMLNKINVKKKPISTFDCSTLYTTILHALVEIKKPCKTGLGYAVLEVGVCFGVLNGMKGQMIRRKKRIRGIVVSLNIFSDWL